MQKKCVTLLPSNLNPWPTTEKHIDKNVAHSCDTTAHWDKSQRKASRQGTTQQVFDVEFYRISNIKIMKQTLLTKRHSG